MAEVNPGAADPAAGGGNPNPAAGGSAGGSVPAFTIPDTYKDKPYLKDVKGYDDVFKMLEGAQSLIGKPRVPKADAPEAELKAFQKELGVPEKFEDYAFEYQQDEKRIPEIDNQVKQIFHKVGLSAKQGKDLQVAYDALVRQQNADLTKAQDDAFEKLATQLWGEKRAEKEQNALKLLSEQAPAEAKFLLDGLESKQLLVIASILDSVKTKFQSEDPKIPRGEGGGGNPVVTEDQLMSKSMELMRSPAYLDPFSPDHNKVRKEISDIHAQIARLSKK